MQICILRPPSIDRAVRLASGENTMATQRGQYSFRVKESERGFFLAAEPVGDVIKALKGGLLAFDLVEGTTLDDAMPRRCDEPRNRVNCVDGLKARHWLGRVEAAF
jgi:hypothetical protein